MFRRIRVRAENGPVLAQALRDAGFLAEWRGRGTAYTNLFHGCSNPECCAQHSAYWNPGGWGSIKTDASGTQAHRIWVERGLLEPCGCKVCKRVLKKRSRGE